MPQRSASLPEGVTVEAARSPADAIGATLPVGFRASVDDDGFTLVVRDRSKVRWMLTFFAVVWNLFLLAFLVAFLRAATEEVVWTPFLLGTGHLLVGLGLGYVTLRLWLNRMELRVSRGVLTVRHRPLPWFAPPPLPREAIEQLFVEEDHSLRVNGQVVPRFRLVVQEKGGKRRKLCLVSEYAQARYLESEVERAFAIADAGVAGEMREG